MVINAIKDAYVNLVALNQFAVSTIAVVGAKKNAVFVVHALHASIHAVTVDLVDSVLVAAVASDVVAVVGDSSSERVEFINR